MKLFWALFIFVFLNSCDPVTEYIKIKNVTEHDIYIVISQKNDLLDNLNPNAPVKLTYENHIQKILPHDSILEFRHGRNAMKTYIFDGDDHKITIAKFNIDTLKKYEWNEILQKKMYMKKYQYTINQLDSMDWSIEIR